MLSPSIIWAPALDLGSPVKLSSEAYMKRQCTYWTCCSVTPCWLTLLCKYVVFPWLCQSCVWYLMLPLGPVRFFPLSQYFPVHDTHWECTVVHVHCSLCNTTNCNKVNWSKCENIGAVAVTNGVGLNRGSHWIPSKNDCVPNKVFHRIPVTPACVRGDFWIVGSVDFTQPRKWWVVAAAEMGQIHVTVNYRMAVMVGCEGRVKYRLFLLDLDFKKVHKDDLRAVILWSLTKLLQTHRWHPSIVVSCGIFM